MTDYHPRFFGDWAPSVTYPSVGYSDDWNGWAVPIVTLDTLRALIADSPGYRITRTAPTVIVETNQDSEAWEVYADLTPRTDGGLTLDLGWTLSVCDDDWARAYAPDVEIWSAGHNIPGYLPESDVALFATQEAARAYLADEIDRLADALADEYVDDVVQEEFSDDSDAAVAGAYVGLIRNDPDGDFNDDFTVYLETGRSLPIAYWVQRTTIGDAFGDDPESDERYADLMDEITDSEARRA